MTDERAGNSNWLLWWARLLPLVTGGGLAISWVVWFLGAVVTGYDLYAISFVALLPLPIALLAWRYHLAGGALIIISYLAVVFFDPYHIALSWPTSSSMGLLFNPLSLVWAVGGVLHLLYWRKFRRAVLGSRSQTKLVTFERKAIAKHETAAKVDGLRWAARLLPLVIGALLAVGVLWGLVHSLLWSYWDLSVFVGLVIGLLPILLALVAWRKHLLGGILIGASGVALLLVAIVFVINPIRFGGADSPAGMFLFLLVPLLPAWTAGGICHLFCWKRLRQAAG